MQYILIEIYLVITQIELISLTELGREMLRVIYLLYFLEEPRR